MVRGEAMVDTPVGGGINRYVSVNAQARHIPNGAPPIPVGLVEYIQNNIDPNDAPFLQHLSRVRVEWLDPNANVLGNTGFEAHLAELEMRKKHKMPPGDVTIGLHPILLEDEKLYVHTLAHEFLHAAGLINHDVRHAEILNAIAPPPKLSESSLLQSIQNQALAQQDVQEWDCPHCGFQWSRSTVRAPTRCPKCAKLFR